MKIKIGINGMGRIGRMIVRSIIENNNKEIEIKHINNRTNSETCSTLLNSSAAISIPHKSARKLFQSAVPTFTAFKTLYFFFSSSECSFTLVTPIRRCINFILIICNF